MISITYKDGTKEDFSNVNDWGYYVDEDGNENNQVIKLINRKFDEDGEYDEDEDEVNTWIFRDDIRKIEIC